MYLERDGAEIGRTVGWKTPHIERLMASYVPFRQKIPRAGFID